MNNIHSVISFTGILADFSDSAVSDVVISDAVTSDAVTSDVSTSDVSVSDVSTSDVSTSDVSVSDVGTSELTLSDASTSGLSFHPENFVSSSAYMGKGMLAIFVTIGIIVIVTAILNKIKTKE